MQYNTQLLRNVWATTSHMRHYEKQAVQGGSGAQSSQTNRHWRSVTSSSTFLASVSLISTAFEHAGHTGRYSRPLSYSARRAGEVSYSEALDVFRRQNTAHSGVLCRSRDGTGLALEQRDYTLNRNTGSLGE